MNLPHKTAPEQVRGIVSLSGSPDIALRITDAARELGIDRESLVEALEYFAWRTHDDVFAMAQKNARCGPGPTD